MANVNGYYKFNLKLAYLNINSITNKIDEVKEMLGKGMFDILFIAESKIDSTTSTTLLAQPGFRLVRRDRKKSGGRLMVYIRADLSVYRRAKLESKEVESIGPIKLQSYVNLRMFSRVVLRLAETSLFRLPYKRLSTIHWSWEENICAVKHATQKPKHYRN